MKIIVLGAGRQGEALAHDLANSRGVEQVTLVDLNGARAAALAKALQQGKNSVVGRQADLSDESALASLFEGHDVAIGAASYALNEGLTRAAIAAGCHFVDLGGNIHVVAAQFAMSEQAKAAGVAIVPDAGLAPGLAGILAMHGVRQLDRTDHVTLRVGGLPLHPEPPLNYALVFSPTGLINEYVEPAEVLRGGEVMQIPSLAEVEQLAFAPPFDQLEAFTTSGGASTLPHTLRGTVQNLDYKTIRYTGHVAIMQSFAALGFFEPPAREITERLFAERLPQTQEDVVLVRVAVEGEQGGQKRRFVQEIVDRFDATTGHTAMMRATAYPAASIARLLGDGSIAERGTLKQEDVVPVDAMLAQLAERGIVVESRWEELG